MRSQSCFEWPMKKKFCASKTKIYFSYHNYYRHRQCTCMHVRVSEIGRLNHSHSHTESNINQLQWNYHNNANQLWDLELSAAMTTGFYQLIRALLHWIAFVRCDGSTNVAQRLPHRLHTFYVDSKTSVTIVAMVCPFKEDKQTSIWKNHATTHNPCTSSGQTSSLEMCPLGMGRGRKI